MDAVPLKHGRKIVAWACGRCGTPGSFGAQGRPWSDRDVEFSREAAAQCCRCHCGAAIERAADTTEPATGLSRFECRACAEKREADMAALREKHEAAQVEYASSWERAQAEHLGAWAFRLENGSTGKLYTVNVHGGVYVEAYARLDPAASVGGDGNVDDSAEEREVFYGGMARSEAPPMLEALRALTARHDCGIALLAAVQSAGVADKET